MICGLHFYGKKILFQKRENKQKRNGVTVDVSMLKKRLPIYLFILSPQLYNKKPLSEKFKAVWQTNFSKSSKISHLRVPLVHLVYKPNEN
jgi:hypothetical protein